MSDHYGNIGRFELYSIEFKKLSGDLGRGNLGRVTIEFGGQRETVYEQDDEENIPIGEPLPLIGPREPITPYDPIYIIFGDADRSSWMICIRGENEAIGVPIRKELHDPQSASVAVLRYGITPKSVDAKFELKYEGDRVIQIAMGEIYATTAGVDATKRLLRGFGPTETSSLLKRNKNNPVELYPGEQRLKFDTQQLEWDMGDTSLWSGPPETSSLLKRNSNEVYPGEQVKLDRSLVAMPLGSTLEVTVNLYYTLVHISNPTDKKAPVAPVRGTIYMSRSIAVPISRSKSSADFYVDAVPGHRLTLTVDWTDDLYQQDMALLNKVISLMDVHIAELKEMGLDPDSHFAYLEEAAGAEASGGASAKGKVSK